MTSDLPPLIFDEDRLEELRAGAGSQFAPRVVSIFLEDPEQVLDAARETSTRAAAGRSRP